MAYTKRTSWPGHFVVHSKNRIPGNQFVDCLQTCVIRVTYILLRVRFSMITSLVGFWGWFRKTYFKSWAIRNSHLCISWYMKGFTPEFIFIIRFFIPIYSLRPNLSYHCFHWILLQLTFISGIRRCCKPHPPTEIPKQTSRVSFGWSSQPTVVTVACGGHKIHPHKPEVIFFTHKIPVNFFTTIPQKDRWGSSF